MKCIAGHSRNVRPLLLDFIVLTIGPMAMRRVGQHSLDVAFNTGVARNVTIIMRSQREWYFTFEADDPITKKPQTYALFTQRGKLRTWCDLRNLFMFLLGRYGVESGKFTLTEELEDEPRERG